eukprot:362223-Chlamydomonas_euryale.AAC.3
MTKKAPLWAILCCPMPSQPSQPRIEQLGGRARRCQCPFAAQRIRVRVTGIGPTKGIAQQDKGEFKQCGITSPSAHNTC